VAAVPVHLGYLGRQQSLRVHSRRLTRVHSWSAQPLGLTVGADIPAVMTAT
jgi:hypothetical protein